MINGTGSVPFSVPQISYEGRTDAVFQHLHRPLIANCRKQRTTHMNPYNTRPLGAIAAAATGVGIIGASTFAVITSAHQDLPHAVLTSAMAAGVVAGAITIGRAWRQGRRSLAAAIAVALVSAELFGVLLSAERIVAEREATQANITKGRAARLYAEEQVVRANHALKAANTAAVTEAAKPGCKAHCRALLEGQVTLAKAAVDDAAQLLAANPAVTASGTPLADRLGVAPWALDLLIAALLAVGANGLGAALVAFGCHAPEARIAAAGSRPRRTGDILKRVEAFQRSGARLVQDVQVPDTDPTPPRGPRKRSRTAHAENKAKVLAFRQAYVAKHGVEPAARIIEAAIGVPKSSAHRYLSARASGADRHPRCVA